MRFLPTQPDGKVRQSPCTPSIPVSVRATNTLPSDIWIRCALSRQSFVCGFCVVLHVLRLPHRTAILKAYGVHAREAVEKIKQDPAALKSLAEGKGKKDWNALMKALESEGAPKEQLITFEEAMKAGK